MLRLEVKRRVGAVGDAKHPAEGSRWISGGRFDLDDVSAPVSQDAAGAGSSYPHSELDDADSG
jgi:hypothetical protein